MLIRGADGSGTISVAELQAGFASIGGNGGESNASLLAAVQAIDASGDGEIDFHEFMDVMTSTAQPGKTMGRAESDALFDLFLGPDGVDGSGTEQMTSNTLQRIFRELGDPIPLSDIDELIMFADHENKRGITRSEFHGLVALGPASRDAEAYYATWQRATGRGVADVELPR